MRCSASSPSSRASGRSTATCNTVVPQWFHETFPPGRAGLAFAAIGVGAMMPGRDHVDRRGEPVHPRHLPRSTSGPSASPRRGDAGQQMVVADREVRRAARHPAAQHAVRDRPAAHRRRRASCRRCPPVALGLYTNWFHRWALTAGLVAGLITGVVMLYQMPQLGGADGKTVVREHFGGSAWPLSNLGIDTDATIYVGIVALAVNLLGYRRGHPAVPDSPRPGRPGPHHGARLRRRRGRPDRTPDDRDPGRRAGPGGRRLVLHPGRPTPTGHAGSGRPVPARLSETLSAPVGALPDHDRRVKRRGFGPPWWRCCPRSLRS